MPPLDGRRIWLVGIGGAGLSGLRAAGARHGVRRSAGGTETRLRISARSGRRGSRCRSRPDPETPDGWEAFVSSAYPGVAGRPRAELLAELVAAGPAIVVAGAHGKTTTAAMIAFVLARDRTRPELDRRGRGATARGKRGRGGGVAGGRGRRVRPVGRGAASAGSGRAQRRPRPPLRVRLPARGGGALRRLAARGARRSCAAGSSSRWTPSWRCPASTTAATRRPRSAALELAGVPRGEAIAALAWFQGVGRRFELVGEAGRRARLRRLRAQPGEGARRARDRTGAARAGVCSSLFQPHLYSRTLPLGGELGTELAAADVVAVTEVYPARERPVAGVTGKLVVDASCDARPGFAPGWTPAARGRRRVSRPPGAARRPRAHGRRGRRRPGRAADPGGARSERGARASLTVGHAFASPTRRSSGVRLAPWDGEVGRSQRRPEAAMAGRGARGAKIEEGVPLARMTTVGIGGPARALARPATVAELEEALGVGGASASWTVRPIGLGSNLLAADDGVDALVVRLEGELAAVEVRGDAARRRRRRGERRLPAPRPRGRARRARVRLRDPRHRRAAGCA